MPVSDVPGSAQGAAPKVSDTLNTFLPDGRGAIDPLKLQPEEDAAAKVPADDTVTETLLPVESVVAQLPVIPARLAGVP